jgi:hypothetical protein
VFPSFSPQEAPRLVIGSKLPGKHTSWKRKKTLPLSRCPTAGMETTLVGAVLDKATLAMILFAALFIVLLKYRTLQQLSFFWCLIRR